MTHGELICEQIAHEVLLATASRIDQPIQRRRLFARQPDKERDAILRHDHNISA
jgi:hypothetical protein